MSVCLGETICHIYLVEKQTTRGNKKDRPYISFDGIPDLEKPYLGLQGRIYLCPNENGIINLSGKKVDLGAAGAKGPFVYVAKGNDM